MLSPSSGIHPGDEDQRQHLLVPDGSVETVSATGPPRDRAWFASGRLGPRDSVPRRSCGKVFFDDQANDPDRGYASIAERTWSNMASSPRLTCIAWKPMKPPSLAASAAACAVVSSHCLKAAISSAVAFELTMALTACSSSRICCPAVAAVVGLKPLSGFCLCWVIAWTSKAISASSCSRVGGLVADFKDAEDSLASSIGPPGSAREIAIPATNGARRTRIHSSSVKSLFVVMTRPSPLNLCRRPAWHVSRHVCTAVWGMKDVGRQI